MTNRERAERAYAVLVRMRVLGSLGGAPLAQAMFTAVTEDEALRADGE